MSSSGPLTIAQKILRAHALEAGSLEPGAVVRASPDLILLNDIGAPLIFRELERMSAERIARPERVVLVNDHFVPAPSLSGAHTVRVAREQAERWGVTRVFELGRDGGIEHTVLAEQGLIAPGELLIGADSHTCTSGAFNAFGAGFGATDIAAALALGWVWMRVPATSRFQFAGQRRPFVTGKDLILSVLAVIGTDGATYEAMEFGGEGVAGLNSDERMALCNMAVEGGAKTGLVEPDGVTEAWARERVRRPFKAVPADPGAAYSSVRDFDLGEIGPMVARPPSPADAVPVAAVAGTRVDQVYIGNCSNGTLTDLRQAARILRGRRVAAGVRAMVVPATQAIYRAALGEGLLATFAEAGFAISTPTCGACFGGHNGLLDDGETAVTTTNRNFRGRMGHAGASIFLANSYVAAAAAVAGQLVDPSEVAGS